MPRFGKLVPLAALLAVIMSLAAPAAAQQQPPAKPYKPVAMSPPTQQKDAELDALRDKMAEATRNRDHAALAKLVVAKGFFWERDGGDATKGRTGIDALTAALGLTNKDAIGWDMLGAYSDDPSVSPAATRKGVLCVPGAPRFDAKAFDALLKETQTDVSEWGYPLTAGVEVRITPIMVAPVIDKLGLAFVRLLPDPTGASAAFFRILTPGGKTGYVAIEQVAPYGNDQLCFVKDGGAWKIGGYIGAGETQ